MNFASGGSEVPVETKNVVICLSKAGVFPVLRTNRF